MKVVKLFFEVYSPLQGINAKRLEVLLTYEANRTLTHSPAQFKSQQNQPMFLHCVNIVHF